VTSPTPVTLSGVRSMDRKVPDVFDVFGIGGPYIPNTPKGGIALPGLVTRREDTQYAWSNRLDRQNAKWREGRSQCERPRTYDKFYQKTPGNFQALDPQTDSAVSMCSSDNEYTKGGETVENDTDGDKDKKRRKGKRILDKALKERRSSKTLTEQDIKHIERHLSMKRTIRKKIMRDLQSNLEDPHPLCPSGHSESNILDMLRLDSQDSGHDSPHRDRKFRSCRVVRRRRKSSHVDSSSEELSNIFSNQTQLRDNAQVVERGVDVPGHCHPHHHHQSLHSYHSLVEPPPDYDDSIKPLADEQTEKKSFWKRLIGRKSDKRKN